MLKQDVESEGHKAIEHKLANIDIESAYRILHTLEQHIDEFDTVVIHEVKKRLIYGKTEVTSP